MGACEGKEAAGASASAEPGLDEVPHGDAAWAAVADLLRERSDAHESHYGYRLRPRRLWRVRQCAALRRHEAEASKLGQPTQLFHGTSEANAQTIAREGFRLPERAGMFGRGVYFADCPLKSANYAREAAGLVTFLWRWATQSFSEAMKRRSGQMLLCDVYLGRSMKLRQANNKLSRPEDLNGGWLDNLLGVKYDSVHAPGGFFLFHAVRVTEYVVYRAGQGIPRYLVEFDYEHLR